MGEICDIVSGSTPRTSDPENWGGPIPWITPDDLSGYAGKSIDGGRRSLTEKGYMSCSAQLVPVGTVLYTSRAPIGYVAIASRSVCTNQGFKSFLPPDGVLSDYIFWYLKYATPEIRKMGSGTTFPEISKKRAESIPIPIAPTAEQRRIVAAIEERFSRIDTGVEALQRARRNMRRMRAAVVQAAVTARLVPQDPNDEPAALLLRRLLGERQAAWSSNGHRGRYRQPDEPKGVLGDIPSGWAWTTVGQLAVRIDYGTSARCSAELKDGVPVLRMGNIQDGELDFSDLKYLPNDHSEIENLLLLDGDILFNRTNSTELVGKSAVFRSFSRPMIFASYLIRLRLSPFVDPRWISMFINGPVGRSYVAAVRVQQVGQANVNGTKLAAMPIALPPASEQRRILEEVDRQLSTIKALDSLVSQAELRGSQLKRGILARGFAGQLVSQDPSEEPVSVLLGRIRAARDAGLSAFHRARRDLR
jgi:type I restriction enzyme S subunit